MTKVSRAKLAVAVLCVLLGLAAVTYGLSLIYYPLTFIVPGIAVGAVGFYLVDIEEEAKPKAQR